MLTSGRKRSSWSVLAGTVQTGKDSDKTEPYRKIFAAFAKRWPGPPIMVRVWAPCAASRLRTRLFRSPAVDSLDFDSPIGYTTLISRRTGG